jgi:predicted N-acetyltransferase YhbS
MNETSPENYLQFLPVQSVDIEDLMAFYKGNLRTWKQHKHYWSWRQEKNPYLHGALAVMARFSGKIVGSVAINPVTITAAGRRMNASWQQDSLVLSSVRGRGVGRRLIEEAGRNFELILAKGTSESMYALRKSAGFQDVANANYLVRIEEPRTLKGRIQEGIAEYLIALWRLVAPRPRIVSDIEVQRVDAFDSSFDALAESLARENILRIFKDRQYLDWRYIQCPGKKYVIYRAGGKEARGAIVINMTGEREGWILDLISLSSDIQCIDALLARAVDHFKANQVARIWVFSTLTSVRKRLYRFGFSPTPKNPRFTYAWNNTDKTNGVPLWDMWHGDGDIELYMK